MAKKVFFLFISHVSVPIYIDEHAIRNESDVSVIIALERPPILILILDAEKINKMNCFSISSSLLLTEEMVY
jgi:hypothetical protein